MTARSFRTRAEGSLEYRDSQSTSRPETSCMAAREWNRSRQRATWTSELHRVDSNSSCVRFSRFVSLSQVIVPNHCCVQLHQHLFEQSDVFAEQASMVCLDTTPSRNQSQNFPSHCSNQSVHCSQNQNSLCNTKRTCSTHNGTKHPG